MEWTEITDGLGIKSRADYECIINFGSLIMGFIGDQIRSKVMVHVVIYGFSLMLYLNLRELRA